MTNHGNALREGLKKGLLEAVGAIPGLGVLIAGLQGYTDSVSQQRTEALLEAIVPHIPKMQEFAEWYSSPQGQKMLRNVADAAPQSQNLRGINNLAQRVTLGPNSAAYRTVHDVTNAVANYYEQKGRFGSVDRNIYGDLQLDAMIGQLQGFSISFMFYMCRDRNNLPCGRNQSDLLDTDTVIARVYEDDLGYWAAIVDIK
jgi:hypothetical protein